MGHLDGDGSTYGLRQATLGRGTASLTEATCRAAHRGPGEDAR
jgi:hypothetical protein